MGIKLKYLVIILILLLCTTYYTYIILSNIFMYAMGRTYKSVNVNVNVKNLRSYTGIPFSTCSKDLLGISEVTLDPQNPTKGSLEKVFIKVRPLQQIQQSTVKITAKVMKIPVYQYSLNMCDYVDCPLEKDLSKNIEVSFQLTDEVPKNVNVNIIVEVYEGPIMFEDFIEDFIEDPEKLSCISFFVKTV